MIFSEQNLPLAKVLFVDEPFSETEGLRALRSRFLWNVVSTTFDADLLLLKSSIYQEKPVSAHSGYDKLYSLSLDSAKTIVPESFHKLGSGQSERFAGILDSKRYELVILAGLACLPLSRIVHKVLPRCPVILDVDSLYLSSLEKAWTENRNLENYNAWWLLFKQRAWDKLLVSKKSHYLFGNPADQKDFAEAYRIPDSRFAYLPLPLPETSVNEPKAPDSDNRFIFFWGEEASPENLAAVRQLIAEIYPRVSKRLVEKNINLVICGPEKFQELCGGRIVFAPLTDLETLLPQALFAVLPLTKPDRELRAMRCAFYSQALICSQAAIEGLALPSEAILAESSNEAIGERILGVLRGPGMLIESARKLHEHYRQAWTPDKINEKLTDILNKRIKPDYE